MSCISIHKYRVWLLNNETKRAENVLEKQIGERIKRWIVKMYTIPVQKRVFVGKVVVFL